MISYKHLNILFTIPPPLPQPSPFVFIKPKNPTMEFSFPFLTFKFWKAKFQGSNDNFSKDCKDVICMFAISFMCNE